MAKKEREIERWITVNGARVPIFKGQSAADAVKAHVDKVGEKKETETSKTISNKTENQRREDDLKRQLETLKGKEFNKDARVGIDDLRARLDEHRRFEGAMEDMDERLKELKKKEAQITKTDAFNPQARKTLKDLRARIDEINQMNRNDAHEPTSYKNDKTSKIISDNEAMKEKQIAANKAQAEKASGKATASTRELSKNYAELYVKTMKGKGKDGKSVTVEFQRGADYYMRKLNKLDPADPLYKKTEQYLAHMGYTKVNGRWQYNEKQAQAHVKETEKLVAKQFGLSKYETGKTLNENYELYGKKRKKS